MNKKWTYDGLGMVLENREKVICREVDTPEDARLIIMSPRLLEIVEAAYRYNMLSPTWRKEAEEVLKLVNNTEHESDDEEKGEDLGFEIWDDEYYEEEIFDEWEDDSEEDSDLEDGDKDWE